MNLTIELALFGAVDHDQVNPVLECLERGTYRDVIVHFLIERTTGRVYRAALDTAGNDAFGKHTIETLRSLASAEGLGFSEYDGRDEGA